MRNYQVQPQPLQYRCFSRCCARVRERGVDWSLRWKGRFIALLAGFLFWAPLLRAQSEPTASRPLDLSTFMGVSRTDVGIDGGRNLGITAGVSLSFPRCAGLVPSLELRGTMPLGEGSIVNEKNFAIGLQVAKPLRRSVVPFANFLVGRNQFSYLNGGLEVPETNVVYTKSASNLFSPGFGMLLHVGSKLSVRIDTQFQYLKTPVTASGYLISIPTTVGFVYHFPSTTHGHPYSERF